MSRHIIFETERLILRHITPADAALIYTLNSSPGVLQYVHEPALKDEADALRVINDIILPQYRLYNLGRLGIELKDDHTFIGWCGLKYLAEQDEVDLGYRLMPQYWGKGYASEAARHTIQYGFERKKLKTIVGRAHINNTASWTILEKLGMQFMHTTEEVYGLIKVYHLHNPNS